MEQQTGFGPLLGRAFHLGRERMDAHLSQYPITPAQTHILRYLFRHGGTASQQAVTAYLQVKPSTANGILNRLEENGLTERSVDSGDARCRFITITERGRQMQALAEQCFQDTEAALLRGFTPEETEMLYRLLRRMIQNLEEDKRL